MIVLGYHWVFYFVGISFQILLLWIYVLLTLFCMGIIIIFIILFIALLPVCFMYHNLMPLFIYISIYVVIHWCAILIAHQIVMAKHGGSCVHFSGISTCGRTSRETVSHPQCPPLPTLCKISLPIYVIVTNKLLQPLTTTWYDSLVLSISLLKI